MIFLTPSALRAAKKDVIKTLPRKVVFWSWLMVPASARSVNVTTTPHHCTGQQPRSEIFRPDRRDGSYTNTTEPHSLHIVVNPITSVHDNAFVNDPIRIAEISFRNTQLNVFVPNSMSDMISEQK